MILEAISALLATIIFFIAMQMSLPSIGYLVNCTTFGHHVY
jgi:hypothetical protein